MSGDEEELTGGNTHESIVKVGSTVRRPTGPWTAAVHDLLTHLEFVGFDGAPRALGFDEEGREILTFIEGRRCVAGPSPSARVVDVELDPVLPRVPTEPESASAPPRIAAHIEAHRDAWTAIVREVKD